MNPELIGDQHFVDAVVQAALPVAAALDIVRVSPLPAQGDGPELDVSTPQLFGPYR